MKSHEEQKGNSEMAESIDVSFSCVCPVIDHELRPNNNVKVAVDPRGDSR